MKKRIFIAVLLVTQFVAGCKQAPVKSTANDYPSQTPEALLHQASLATKENQYRYLLDAASLLLVSGEQAKAAKTLQQLDKTTLPQHALAQFYRVQAELSLWQKSAAALDWLNKLEQVNDQQQLSSIKLHQLKAEAYQQSAQPIEALREYISLQPQLSGGEADENITLTWQSALNIAPEMLTTLQTESAPDVMTGWLQLAQLYHENANNPQQLINSYRFWKTQYPKHPVLSNLPNTFANADNFQATQFKQVAVLLPLTGQFSGLSKLIQKGMIAANMDTDNALTLNFYDTETTPVPALVKTVITDGNDIVLGPLHKEKVIELVNLLPDNMPVLTLNKVDELPFFKHVFQFGLTPEDELLQIAQRAKQQNYDQAWMIVPDNDFGQRLEQSFSSIWSSFGGQLTNTIKLKPDTNLNEAVQQLLAISGSEQRKKQLQGMLGRKLEFKPRRRKDADFILIAIPAQQARQIKPLLHFHFASDLPLYGNSTLSNHYGDTYLDKDLDGILVTETPLLVSRKTTLDHYRQEWPNFFGSTARLFAFGYDAYYLINELSYLQNFEQYQYQGLTGALSVNQQNHIHRELDWATYQRGELIEYNELLDQKALIDDEDDTDE